MVTEQVRPVKSVASDLGVCIETLRSRLKNADVKPSGIDRQNRTNSRQRELEAEVLALRKQLTEKDEVITI